MTGAYAITGTRRPDGSRGTVMMHNLIMGARFIDHANHNGLDNQRHNLRLATDSQNQGNKRRRRSGTSRYKGVSWSKQHKRWVAQIRKDDKLRHLGLFGSQEDAARTYDAAAREMFGAFACLNFPGPGESSALSYDEPEATAAVPGGERLPAAGMSPYLGAVWAADKSRWQARITFGGRQRHLGFYASDIEAGLAYDAAARGVFGDGARLNFPDGLTPELEILMAAQQEAGRAEAAARLAGANAGRSAAVARREPETRTCEVCGGEYQTVVIRPTKHCGDACNEKARQKRRRDENARKALERVPLAGICQVCGDEYTHQSERSLYCTDKCRQSAYKARKRANAAQADGRP